MKGEHAAHRARTLSAQERDEWKVELRWPNEVVSKRERGEWVALCAGGLGAAAASVRPAG